MPLTPSRSSDLPEGYEHLAKQRKCFNPNTYKLGDLEKLRERYKALNAPEQVDAIISDNQIDSCNKDSDGKIIT